MKFLQIGKENWTGHFEGSEDIVWYYSSIEGLSELLDELSPSVAVSEGQKPKKFSFDAVLLTSEVDEEELEILSDFVEAYAVFFDSSVSLKSSKSGFFRKKLPQKLLCQGTPEEKLEFIVSVSFSGQYGDKLLIGDIDISPNFTGRVNYFGNISVVFDGDFGDSMMPLFSYRYNLATDSSPIEIWQEYYKKDENCWIQIELTPFYHGSWEDMAEQIVLTEKDMKNPVALPVDDRIGGYAVTIFAKGDGKIHFGPMHRRLSRRGQGCMVLGGQRFNDAKRQELLFYFNPGDLQPPLNVYFSGYRSAEGFEGFRMMKSMGAPFLLIADPRLEGGGFYTGSSELEKSVESAIRDCLNFLDFNSSQLILSGLSMGTFGALYYASTFNPSAVVVGKPFTNLGDMATNLKIKRPNAFETATDIVMNIVGGTDKTLTDKLNQKFWNKFQKSNFSRTSFAIAFMENDDYDVNATSNLIEHLSEKNAHIYTKGYSGRHNDNSPAVNKWFMQQYQNILSERFERK